MSPVPKEGEARQPREYNDRAGPRSAPADRANGKRPAVPEGKSTVVPMAETANTSAEGDVDVAEEGRGDDAMAAMLGISGFGTTKGKPKKVHLEGANVKKERSWRQYMNRYVPLCCGGSGTVRC